ncbi:TPA: hypothetical protein I7730_00355 [Vibrio vulnificus]|uniref:Uncharacterized protein n=1 Tax=Vibrio vulnificus TaxID=672 RepID=A0A8H9K525_VIBVL|nr:hypothetical protein [Vibrio vulnificus]HAS8538250.1 hypothetical protein [Vibrio vulnificus]
MLDLTLSVIVLLGGIFSLTGNPVAHLYPKSDYTLVDEEHLRLASLGLEPVTEATNEEYRYINPSSSQEEQLIQYKKAVAQRELSRKIARAKNLSKKHA